MRSNRLLPRLPRTMLAALVGLPLAGVTLWAAPARPPAAAPAKAARTVAIPVHGMMCMSCAATIRQQVKELPGVSNVEVNLAQAMVRVTYAANQPNLPARIVSSINALGYHAGNPMVVR